MPQNPSLSARSYQPQTVNRHNFLHHKHKHNYASHMCWSIHLISVESSAATENLRVCRKRLFSNILVTLMCCNKLLWILPLTSLNIPCFNIRMIFIQHYKSYFIIIKISLLTALVTVHHLKPEAVNL